MNSEIAILLSLLFIFNINWVTSSEEYDFGFVIDAGSTGSRIYAYQWKRRFSSVSPNQVTAEDAESRPREIGDTLKVGPISSITSLDSAKSLIIPMIEHVKSITISEKSRWNEFPIFLKATAGMRILDHLDRIKIFGWIDDVFNDDSINPFLFSNSYSIIASGTEEATYDWLSVNYLLSILTDDDETKTYGALDLGGASTQIAFAPQPSSDIIDSFTYIDPFNYPFRLYAVSHLGYGTNEFERLIAAKVYKLTYNKEEQQKNPCLLTGTTKIYDYIRYNGESIYNVEQIGTSDPVLCEEYMIDLLYLNQPICDVFDYGEECSMNGVYIPHIPDDMEWVAFSAFAYTVDDLEHGLNDRSSIAELYDVAMNQICKYTLDELNEALPGLYNPQTMCLLNLYIVVLLRDGYHFDINKHNILWTNSINGQSSGWQWGSILYDANLLGSTYICNKTESSVSESVPFNVLDHNTKSIINEYHEGFSTLHLILSFFVGASIILCLFIGIFIGNNMQTKSVQKFNENDL